MKSALFVQANVAVNTKLQCFFKKIGKKRAISVWYEGKFVFQLPRCHHFRENFFRCPFQYPKVPLEAGAPPPPPPPPPQSFDASYAPDCFSIFKLLPSFYIGTGLQVK
jgi:hypothetical protein